MNNPYEEHGLKQMQNKKKSNNSLLIRSLHSKKSNLTNENELNTIQRNKINANSHALETLSDAALNVKNMLSDFLVNADEDDKKIYHIDDELKRIRNNNDIDCLNLFNNMNEDGDNLKENEEYTYFRNFNNNDNLNISHLKNLFDLDKKIVKRGKRVSLLLPKSKEIEKNDENFIRNNKTIKYGPSSIGKKLTKNSNDDEHILKSNFTMKKIKKKKTKKSNKNLIHIHSPVHSPIKKQLSKFSNEAFKLENPEIEKEKRKNFINEKDKKIISGLKNKIGFDEIENQKIIIKSNSIKTPKKKIQFVLNKKEDNEIKPCKSLNESLDMIPDNNIEEEINNSNFYTRNFKTKDEFGENKLNKKKLALQQLSQSYKFGKDKHKIRKYFNLEKKELSDLCDNLRNSITLKSKTNTSENENNITNNTDNIIDKKKTLKKSHDQLLRILTINNKEELKSEPEIFNMKDDKTLLLKNNEESSFESDENNTDRLLKEYHFRRLTKPNGLVYDSISDEESLQEIEGELYFNPNGNFIYYYDLILFILSFYAVIFPPLDLAFNHESATYFLSFSLIMNFVIDIFFIIDFFLGFFTAFLDFEETLISNNKSIVIHYLLGWFFVDLLSGIPINSIFIIIEYKKSNNSLILTYVDYSWKVYQLFRFFKLLKLLKTCSNNSFTNSLINFINEYEILEKWFTLFVYIGTFFVSMHLLSCIFIFLAQLEHPNWVYTYNFEFNHDNIDIYFASFYYICATVFTIGYGDIISVSSYEKFFNLILLVFGMVIYSYIISALSNYVQSVDSKTLEYKNKLAILEQIKVTYDKMPQILYDKISKFLIYRLHNEKRDKNDIMENIPLTVKNQLIMEMYKDIINNFMFFKNFDNSDFIIKVILALKPIQASRNERLVNEGDYIEEIIFVKKGILSLEIPLPIIINENTNDNIVETNLNKQKTNTGPIRISKILDPNNTLNKNLTNNEIDTQTIQELKKENPKTFEVQYVKIIEIRRNEHFGDVLMFLNKRSPLSVKVKTKISELFLLQKTDALEISMSFPTIWRKIIKKSLFNMEQIERLVNKTLKLFFLHYHGGKKRGSFLFRDLKNNKYRESKTLLDVFNNNNDELYKLKTIPTILSQYEEEEEEDDEEEEEEEEESENESNNESESKNESNKGNENENNKENEGEKNILQKSRKFETNIKTIIKEVDENSYASDIESSNNNKKDSLKTAESKKESNYSVSKLEDKDSKLKSNKNSDSNLGNSKIEIDSSSNFDNNSLKTNKTNIKNNLIDMSNDNISYDDKEKDKRTLSSNNKTYQYSLEEINNESMPFEQPFIINENETLSSNLIPYSLKMQNNYQDHNKNFLFDESLRQNKSLNKNFIDNKTEYFKITLDNENIENNEEDNDNENNNTNLYNYSSFEYLTIQSNEDFSLKRNKKVEDENKNIDNKLNINRVNSSPIAYNLQNKLKNNLTNKSFIENSESINEKKNSTIRKNKQRSSFDQKLRRISFEEKNLPFSTFIKTQNTGKRKKKSTSNLLNDIKEKLSTISLENGLNEKIENDLQKKEHSKSVIKDPNVKKDHSHMLDLIINNIEKNSLNLNNPQYFYSTYFSSMMDKEENKPKKTLNDRLKKIVNLVKFKNH